MNGYDIRKQYPLYKSFNIVVELEFLGYPWLASVFVFEEELVLFLFYFCPLSGSLWHNKIKIGSTHGHLIQYIHWKMLYIFFVYHLENLWKTKYPVFASATFHFVSDVTLYVCQHFHSGFWIRVYKLSLYKSHMILKQLQPFVLTELRIYNPLFCFSFEE